MRFLLIVSFLLSTQAFAKKDDCSPEYWQNSKGHWMANFKCVEVVNNYDGDTLKVNLVGVGDFFGNSLGVRVYGIDTPEMKGKRPCEKERAQEAKEYLTYRLSLARNNSVELRNSFKGKYFRLVSQVYVNGRNLGNALIERGLAVEYYGDTKPNVDWCDY